MVHHHIQWLAPVLGDRGGKQRCVVGLLHRFENERGIGRGVLGLEGVKLFEVARVGNDGGVLLERVELVHKIFPGLKYQFSP